MFFLKDQKHLILKKNITDNILKLIQKTIESKYIKKMKILKKLSFRTEFKKNPISKYYDETLMLEIHIFNIDGKLNCLALFL